MCIDREYNRGTKLRQKEERQETKQKNQMTVCKTLICLSPKSIEQVEKKMVKLWKICIIQQLILTYWQHILKILWLLCVELKWTSSNSVSCDEVPPISVGFGDEIFEGLADLDDVLRKKPFLSNAIRPYEEKAATWNQESLCQKNLTMEF